MEHLSFTDAAEQVIREQNKPLSYSTIAEIALKKKLIRSEANDPALSMYVSLRSEIKRRSERKEPQRFLFLGKGVFSLEEIKAPVPNRTRDALQEVKESRQQASKTLYERLTKQNSGKEFEAMVADLVLKMGYTNVEVIGGSDDQGVDILCEKREGLVIERVAIQCKCKSMSQKIGPKDISTLRDNLSTYQCQKGVLVTTTTLTDSAREKAKEASKEPIHYIEHKELLDLFTEHEVGLKSETLQYFKIDFEQYSFLKD